MMRYQNRYRMPAEWEPQSMVQLTWPHQGTDWAPILGEITETYLQMAREIAKREPLLIVVPSRNDLPQEVLTMENTTVFECPTNDTWARDHGFVTIVENGGQKEQGDEDCHSTQELVLLDFQFNGWGKKFEAEKDNAINRQLWNSGILSTLPTPHPTRLNPHSTLFTYQDHNDFVLEGGSIESDGKGTIYTTRCCLTAPNRNEKEGRPMTEQEIEEDLKRRLCADRIVWLDDEPLPGDDTDGHIDTIARITPDGTLLRLPLPDPIYDEDGSPLPATYANYLIINGAVLVPTYGQPDHDAAAIQCIAKVFPDREIVPIDSRSIIKQHGSIHCCTMQYY